MVGGIVTAGLDPEGLLTGGGALEAEGLKRAAQAVNGGEYVRGSLPPPPLIGRRSGELPGNFFKIYVSENAFQAIF